MSIKQTNAANTIKRAMLLNRSRINSMNQNIASDKVLVAKLCVYDYTDDRNDCKATMGNDWSMLMWDDALSSYNNEEMTRKTKSVMNIGRISGWSSKKIMRHIYQSYTIGELHTCTGWGN